MFFCSLVQPDGRVRTVHYQSDGKNGFQAIVKYEGKAHHPAHYGGSGSSGHGDSGSGHGGSGSGHGGSGSGHGGSGSGHGGSGAGGYGGHGSAHSHVSFGHGHGYHWTLHTKYKS